MEKGCITTFICDDVDIGLHYADGAGHWFEHYNTSEQMEQHVAVCIRSRFVYFP